MVKTKKKTFECEDCGKELKNARALAGHMWFAHQRRYGEVPNLKEEVKLLQEEKGTNPDSIERIEKIENLVGELLDYVKELIENQKSLIALIGKFQSSGNPGNPGKTKNKLPDQEKKRQSFHDWLFGEDVKKESKETNDLLDIFNENKEESVKK